MIAVFNLVNTVFSIYIWVLFIYIIMGWLFYFQVINSYNQIVNSIYGFLQSITEPFLRPIRRLIPIMGGLDISVIILLLIVYFLRDLIVWDILAPMAYGS